MKILDWMTTVLSLCCIVGGLLSEEPSRISIVLGWSVAAIYSARMALELHSD